MPFVPREDVLEGTSNLGLGNALDKALVRRERNMV